MEIWDGYYPDGTLAGIDLVRGELIPANLRHLVCEALVRHTDGDYLLMQRDYSKPNYGGSFESTAGGSALKGEDSLTCVFRELREETGICADTAEHLGTYVSHDTIYQSFLITVACDKTSVRLQQGETIAYKWLSDVEFADFVRCGKMIPTQQNRLQEYLRRTICRTEN